MIVLHSKDVCRCSNTGNSLPEGLMPERDASSQMIDQKQSRKIQNKKTFVKALSPHLWVCLRLYPSSTSGLWRGVARWPGQNLSIPNR